MTLKYRKLLVGLSLLSLGGFTACDKNDDPDAIDVKNLKNPRTFTIVDNGDGSIKLNWQASNFEGDFEGYNVYGVKMSDDEIAELAEKGLAKGKPIQLLDGEGNARSEAKDILQKLNYDPENALEKAKATEPTDENERKISYLPIHNKDGDDPVLPTCYPSENADGSIECVAYTKDNVEKVKDEDDGELSANGAVYYNITGLTPGEQYCFVIFSVQDDGEEISQTSTTFECVIPTIEVEKTFTAATQYQEFKVRTYAAACTTTCPTIDGTYVVNTGAQSTPTSTGAVYIEHYGGSTTKFIVAGDNCGLLDMGVRSGLTDASLPTVGSPDFPVFGNEEGAGKAYNVNGYSAPGASVVLASKHAYILACDDADDAKKSVYHWFFVNNESTAEPSSTQDITMKIRVGLSSVAK